MHARLSMDDVNAAPCRAFAGHRHPATTPFHANRP